jgi:hypothetical protein
MTGLALKNRDNLGQFREIRPNDFGMENALAGIVRRRWPSATTDNVSAEWGLSAGEAKGVVYATASRTTLNKIMKHRRGGMGLWLEIIAEVTGERLDSYIQRQAEEAVRERTRWEAEEQRLSRMEASLRARRPALHSVDR